MSANTHLYLTDGVIERAEAPASGETRLWDIEFKGFLVRVWPSGRKSFCIRYRRARRLELYTIGPFKSPWTTEQARAKATEVFLRYADSHKPARDRKLGHAMTVTELCDRYLKEGPLTKVGKRASSWSLDTGNLRRHVQPLIGKYVVADLKRSNVAQMIRDVTLGITAGDFRTKKQGIAHVRGGATAAERVLTSFRAMLNWAIAQDILTDNPAKGLSLPKRPPVERFLSDEEATQLFGVLDAGVADHTINPQHADLVRLLLLTGARKSELMGLRWDELDMRRSRLVLPPARSKSGRLNGYRRIPLNAAAKALLAEIPHCGSEFVFPSDRSEAKPMTGIQKTWKHVCQKAGLGKMRLHDLRHSFASFAIANGENIVLIAAALGHASTRMTERYLHLRDHDVSALAERTGQRILACSRKKTRRKSTIKFPVTAQIIP